MAASCWALIPGPEFSETRSMRLSGTTHPLVPTAQYLSAIAHHVSSVCVITTEVDGERFGLTATAVSSVSAEPPRLLVCVNKSGMTHEKIIAVGRFGVNVLAEGQDKVAIVFAGLHGLKGRPLCDGRMDDVEDGRSRFSSALRPRSIACSRKSPNSRRIRCCLEMSLRPSTGSARTRCFMARGVSVSFAKCFRAYMADKENIFEAREATKAKADQP